jgi:hypothetical protein
MSSKLDTFAPNRSSTFSSVGFIQSDSSSRLASMIQVAFGFVVGITLICGDSLADELESGFRFPPPEARPLTMAQWVNGNVTREGITADLEAMKRVGIQGLLLFDVDLPFSPKGPVETLGKEWWQLMRHTASEAERLGLEFGFHNCPGWTASGGPWITPELAMQKLVWTEKTITGPMPVTISDLPQPKIDKKWNFYRDVALLAVPANGGASVVLTEKKDLPAGTWRVFRFGHTTTGKTNAPASKAATGLECDKFNPLAIEIHFNSYVKRLLDEAGDLAGRSLNMVEMDSYEAGPQDWTARFPEKFRQRRGYDIIPWLPALAGVTVGSAAETLKFREDMRRTIADLFDEHCFGRFADLVRARKGMKFVVEPYGGAFDVLTTTRHGDLTAATFWMGAPWGIDDIRVNASAAHTWGKRIVGCEAFTGAPLTTQWNQDPYSLKPLGDLAFTKGANRMILHTMAHQPWLTAKPGMTLGYFGTHFGRTQTWWEQSKPWFDYLSRCQVMLQQGIYAADVLMLDQQGVPLPVEGAGASSSTAKRPQAPAGYQGDLCSEMALIRRASVRNGRIEFPDGMNYRLLVLPDTNTMTLNVARKVRDLVAAGATVIGPRPTDTPGLEGGEAARLELLRITAKLWDSEKIKAVGMSAVITQLGVIPAFSSKPSDLAWIHRRTSDAEIFFLSNQQPEPRTVECSFRVTGKQPELWDPSTGSITDAASFRLGAESTSLPIRFDAHGSVFVIFRKRVTKESGQSTNWPVFTKSMTLSGPWQVAFDPAWGGPTAVVFPDLQDWSTHPESGIRHYSGTATYSKNFDLSELRSPIHLDLGNVKNLAEVELNGKKLGILWKPPFRCDISHALKIGTNKLTVRITNLWPNRLIGDEHEPPDIAWGKEGEWRHSEPHGKIGRPMASLPPWLVNGQARPSKGRFTVTSWNYYTKDSPLLPSGLLGPVTILREVPATPKSE